MPNQPAGWPITGTTAITPIRGTQGRPPNRANASEKVPWHLTEFPIYPNSKLHQKQHRSCYSYFLSININCLSFTWISWFCNMHFWEEILKVLHPSSSKYQKVLTRLNCFVFLNTFSDTPEEIPGGETPTFAIKLRLRILWTLRKGLLGPEAEPAGWTQRITNSMCKDLVVFLLPKDLAHRIPCERYDKHIHNM